ncbi:non-homologous end-joining DNA ligase [Kitasatospora sp. NPDC086009]|uniref:non-homologous end-joining DNA ligase n=1 Tax=unclassified Kitasatospora TaxID=2633591 RepID=UPI0037CCA92A
MASRGSARVRLPHIEPMLATAGPLPSGPGWCAEVKWDGARACAYLEDGRARLLGRHGTDYTERFPEVAAALADVPGPLVLDGELVVMRSGTPSFAALQGRIHRTRPASVQAGARAAPALFIAFDLPHTDRPLLTEPYRRRRALLEDLNLDRPGLRVPPAWESLTDAVAWTREHQLEGIICKRADSPYRPGARSRDWIKIKHLRTADVVIGGWLPGGPAGTTVRAVLVGAPTGEPGRLLYAGSVGTGFTAAERRALAAALRRLDQSTSPFTGARTGLGLPRGTEVRFVRPELHAEVEFLELTPAGRLRQPVWRGLRAGPS